MRRQMAWLRRVAGGIFARHIGGQAGMALPVLLGAILILGLVVAGMAGLVQAQLRSVRLDQDVVQTQSLVVSALQDEAAQVQNDLDTAFSAQPDPNQAFSQTFVDSRPAPDSPVRADWPCTPSAHANGELYCTYRLRAVRNPIWVDNQQIDLWQIPIAIWWKLRPSDTAKVTYAWILVDFDTVNGTSQVVYLFGDHRFCRTTPNWTPGMDVCGLGG